MEKSKRSGGRDPCMASPLSTRLLRARPHFSARSGIQESHFRRIISHAFPRKSTPIFEARAPVPAFRASPRDEKGTISWGCVRPRQIDCAKRCKKVRFGEFYKIRQTDGAIPTKRNSPKFPVLPHFFQRSTGARRHRARRQSQRRSAHGQIQRGLTTSHEDHEASRRAGTLRVLRRFVVNPSYCAGINCS
jgi:hypothetical protein